MVIIIIALYLAGRSFDWEMLLGLWRILQG
jgi:hypothetical protein